MLPSAPPSVIRELREVESIYARDYSLRAYTPYKLGKKPLGFVSNVATEWQRSTTFTGGPWRGTFTIKGPIDVLEVWFYEGLGRHIEEYAYGQKTWVGLVWEMDLVAPDRTNREVKRWKRRRISYEPVANRVRCDYTDPDDNSTGSTSWYSDAASIARYGQKEEIIQRNLNSTNAAEAAQEYLELFAVPIPELISLERPSEEPMLEVTVTGYISTANFRFTATANDSTTDIDTWISDIFDTDLAEFFYTNRVATNARTIVQALTSPTRAWTLLEDLTTLRDGSGNRFNVTTDADRRGIRYKLWTNAPIGKLMGGALKTIPGSDLESVARMIQPGIYRDVDYLGTVASRHVTNLSSFFASPADFLLDTVEVDDEGGFVPRLGVYEDEEALRTFVFKKDKD